jgi:hypothetical protein
MRDEGGAGQHRGARAVLWRAPHIEVDLPPHVRLAREAA